MLLFTEITMQYQWYSYIDCSILNPVYAKSALAEVRVARVIFIQYYDSPDGVSSKARRDKWWNTLEGECCCPTNTHVKTGH